MLCKKCKSNNLIIRPNAKKPDATELICGDCGAWQKFLNKSEIRLFEIREQLKSKTSECCEFCDGVPSRYKAIRAEGFYQVAADEVYNPELDVNFCPVCGRRLENEQ